MDKTTNTDIKSVSKSRRNLIKASAAAPVIASLHPGAAIAQSSVSACSNNNHYPKFQSYKDDDTAVRDQMLRFKRKNYSDKWPEAFYFVDESDNEYYDPQGNLWRKAAIKHHGSTYYVFEKANNKNSRVSTFRYTSHAEKVWTLVLFDVGTNNGRHLIEKGPWPKHQLDGHNSAISRSCATSIDPHGHW